MSKTGSSVTEYDWLTEGVLKELRSMDGEATTTELKDRTGAEKTYKVRYRVTDKLEPEGFVETEQPPAEPGNTPPKIVRLTSRGEGLADQLLDAGDSDNLSISAEVDQLHAEVNKLESTIEDQQETIDELVESHDEIIDWINETEG